MAVHINEVIVRITVDPEQQEKQASNINSSSSKQSHVLDEADISEIVLEIIKAKKER